MADFKHIQGLDFTSEDTAEFPIYQIVVNGKTPVLLLAPATDANKPYFNALLRRANKNVRVVRSGGVNIGMLEENRAEDLELFPKYVVRGWKDVIGNEGEEVKFNVEDCTKFLAALPSWIFDEIRNFAGNPASFSDILEVETNAGN